MSSRPTAFEARLKTELVAIAADRAASGGGLELVAGRPARRPRIPMAVGTAARVMGVAGAAGAAGMLKAVRAAGGLIALRKPEGLKGLPQE
ncbi:hypothetical protein OG730_14105 [Streptomyces sp. NBC_01298]|uniref:hypothetical protein n=1 Tax=Streptomyces sp. NBC_01298 TaxID=2903817 RepID=UPI002E0DCBAF|nr:hypothetical protein OG730_14105 [Streptomyces sp. NBC_01298]